jgi:hypothetical protein
MRRTVVTPTFAAGLGVVIAAMLAYPMGKVVFHYIAPSNGQPCPASGCGSSGGRGTLASASPGQPLVTAGPHVGGREAGEGAMRAGVSTSPRPAAGQPLLSYRTMGHWHGGFTGQITVSFPTGHVPSRWSLRFSYPSQQIRHVWSRSWRMSQRSGHSVVVIAPAGAVPGPGHSGDPVWFGVSGQAGEPPVCFFDHVACLFSPAVTGHTSQRQASAQQQQGARHHLWQRHHQHSNNWRYWHHRGAW